MIDINGQCLPPLAWGAKGADLQPVAAPAFAFKQAFGRAAPSFNTVSLIPNHGKVRRRARRSRARARTPRPTPAPRPPRRARAQ